MASERILIFLGNIIHCTKQFKIHIIENGFVMVLENKVLIISRKIISITQYLNNFYYVHCVR